MKAVGILPFANWRPGKKKGGSPTRGEKGEKERDGFVRVVGECHHHRDGRENRGKKREGGVNISPPGDRKKEKGRRDVSI